MTDADLPSPLGRSAVVVARVVRGGVVESEHRGHAVALDAAGAALVTLGDPGVTIFARSSLKPLQAVAMLDAGLDLEPRLLALACASHSGEERHTAGALEILHEHGLGEQDLQNTPDLPAGADAQREWLKAGRGPTPLAQNCSGKHAAMLATCVRAGWPAQGYLDPEHPLQQRVRSVLARLTGGPVAHVTTDGCGAPLYSCTLLGLSRAFGELARAAAARDGSSAARVGAAMAAHPGMVGGTGRDVTILMSGIPGLVAKDGAEGVYAVGLPDGRSAALKVLDGAQRPRPVVMSALLRALGVTDPVLDEVGTVPVLGHGRPVGQVVAAHVQPGTASPGTASPGTRP